MEWHDLLGALGAAMVVVTYALLQFGRLASTALSYSLFNALGAGLILLSLSIDFNFSAFVIEAFWLLISLAGIIRCASAKRGL
jgi:hypothetical protein